VNDHSASSAVTGGFALPSDAAAVRNPADGTLIQLKGANLSQPLERDPQFLRLLAERKMAEASSLFLQTFRGEFRLKDPAAELKANPAESDDLGYTHVRFRQFYAGMPVKGGELIVHWNRNHQIYLVNGRYAPTPENVAAAPAIDRARAVAIALAAAVPNASECPDCTAELAVYTAETQPPRLAYRVHVSGFIRRTQDVWVDANDGRILQQLQLDKTFR
jgi:Zn-dependent metalloprotease